MAPPQAVAARGGPPLPQLSLDPGSRRTLPQVAPPVELEAIIPVGRAQAESAVVGPSYNHAFTLKETTREATKQDQPGS